jgi:superfamily II DNA/RNA helicase
MIIENITVKPNNHRIHPCLQEKKLELLEKIISNNINSNLLIIISDDIEIITDSLLKKNVSVINDNNLSKYLPQSYDLIVSLDIPSKPEIYIHRLSLASNEAILLLNESEQKSLYHIEMLLGRVIKQKVIKGFEYEVKKNTKASTKSMSKEKIKEVAKQRYEAKTQLPKEKSISSEKWAKKKKEPNKFLGYDENGKAKFSGKSGERNHKFDGKPKESFTTPKKVGRKISIKVRNNKED